MSNIKLFPKKRYGGQPKELETSAPSLKGSGVNHDVESVIVTSGAWLLCSEPDFGGDTWRVTIQGSPNKNGDYPEPAAWRGNTRKIRSVKLLG